MPVQTYLDFDGRTEEAHAFYREVLGAEVTEVIRFQDSPDGGMPVPPGGAQKILHSTFRINGTELMATDGACTGHPQFKGVMLTLTTPTDAEALRLFNALAEGGEVRMPMGKAFFASSFGEVADRFGVSWMVLTET